MLITIQTSEEEDNFSEQDFISQTKERLSHRAKNLSQV